MKKRKFFVIVGIILILIIMGLILVYEKINKISFIENIKKAIEEQENVNSIQEITTVDVTSLEDNGNLEHEHIIKTNYDATKHWDECIICGQKSNEMIHKYTDSWTMGSANNCSEKNIHKFVCECGYTYSNTTGRKGHGSMNNVYLSSKCRYYQECVICYSQINRHDCYLSNGTKISCKNLGICKICGFNYNKNYVKHYSNTVVSEDLQNICCSTCGKKFPLKFDKFELKEIDEGQSVIEIDATYELRYNI